VPRRIDHLVYAVSDLETACQQFCERYDLTVVGRGSHDDAGPANVLLSLGSSYLELIMTVDRSSEHPLAVRVMNAATERDQLIGFAIEVDDVEAEARRLGTVAVPMARSGALPGRWHLTGVEAAMNEIRPFFIEWEDGRPDTTDDHRLKRLELFGDSAILRLWIGRDVEGVVIAEGEPALTAVLSDGSTLY
jgi:hypothetical protein